MGRAIILRIVAAVGSALLGAFWWVVDRLYGDRIFTAIEPHMPSWLTAISVSELGAFAYTWIPPLLMVGLAVYLSLSARKLVAAQQERDRAEAAAPSPTVVFPDVSFERGDAPPGGPSISMSEAAIRAYDEIKENSLVRLHCKGMSEQDVLNYVAHTIAFKTSIWGKESPSRQWQRLVPALARNGQFQEGATLFVPRDSGRPWRDLRISVAALGRAIERLTRRDEADDDE